MGLKVYTDIDEKTCETVAKLGYKCDKCDLNYQVLNWIDCSITE